MSMNEKPDVLDTFSKVMFFSKWNSPNQTTENKKKREEDIAFIQSELERLVELDRISDLVKDTEPAKALEELKNGLFGHCKSSYLKDDPKELEKILDIYGGFFNIIENELKVAKMEHTLRIRLEDANYELVRERDKYKKVVEMLKDNISLDFTRYPQSDRHEVWLNNGDEEQILIANTKEDYEFLKEILK